MEGGMQSQDVEETFGRGLHRSHVSEPLVLMGATLLLLLPVREAAGVAAGAAAL